MLSYRRVRTDYYEILGVGASADASALKAAYRRQAMRFHPDHNQGDVQAEERFKLVVEAWQVLGDAESRADYDAWLERQRRYARAPELAGLGSRVRVSARHGRERREERAHRARSRRARVVWRPSGKKSPVTLVVRAGLYLLVLTMLLPILLDTKISVSPAPAQREDEGEVVTVSLSEARKIYRLGLLERAQQGDTQAQFEYGCLLYDGANLYDEEGGSPDLEGARTWLEQAAAAGHEAARRMLEEGDFSAKRAEELLRGVREWRERLAGGDAAAAEGTPAEGGAAAPAEESAAEGGDAAAAEGTPEEGGAAAPAEESAAEGGDTAPVEESPAEEAQAPGA